MVIYISVRTFLTGKIQFFCLKNLYWFFIIIIISSSSSRHPTCATGAIEPSWSLHLSYIHISYFFFLNWVYTVNFTEWSHSLYFNTVVFWFRINTLELMTLPGPDYQIKLDASHLVWSDDSRVATRRDPTLCYNNMQLHVWRLPLLPSTSFSPNQLRKCSLNKVQLIFISYSELRTSYIKRW